MWLVLWWPEPALYVKQHLLFARWFSQPCWWQGLLPSWSRSPQILFWAVAWDRPNWSTPTEKEATEYSSAGAVHSEVLCGVTCHLMCRLTKYSVVGTDLSPTSTMGTQAIGPDVPQALYSQTTSTNLPVQIWGTQALGPSVGAMESAQTPAPPPCARACKAHSC